MRSISWFLLIFHLFASTLSAHSNATEQHNLVLTPNPTTSATPVVAVFSGIDVAFVTVGTPVVEGDVVSIPVTRMVPPILPAPKPFLHEIDLGTFPGGTAWHIEFTDEFWLYASAQLVVEEDVQVAGPEMAFVPPLPSPADPVNVLLEVSDRCVVLGPVTRDGRVFEIELARGCRAEPGLPLEPHQFEIPLGNLSLGDWTVQVVDPDTDSVVLSRSLTVYDLKPRIAIPPNARAGEPIPLVFNLEGIAVCPVIVDIEVVGHDVEVTFAPECLLAPPPIFPPTYFTSEFELDPLPPAPYRVRLAETDGAVWEEVPFVVLPPGRCATDDHALCLSAGQFEVTATWKTEAGEEGIATPRRLTDDSGTFWFFEASNTELVVKLVDACGPQFDRFWVFASGLTNVEVTLRVKDLVSGQTNTYLNPLGHPFEPILDTQAFATCPVPGSDSADN